MKKIFSGKIYAGYILVLIAVLIFQGCPENQANQPYYVAGEIKVNSLTPVEVSLAFYSKDCEVEYNSSGELIGLTNFVIVGDLYTIQINSSSYYQVTIPENYLDIGGFIAWLDTNKNGLPDPFAENVKLPVINVDGNECIVIGIEYEESTENFLIKYDNNGSIYSQYLSIIGNNGYNFVFN